MERPRNRDDYPFYVLAIEAFQKGERKEFLRLLEHEAFTQIERSLLKARELLKAGSHDSALEFLSRLTASNDFFAGEKHILLGTYWFFRGDFQRAALMNQIAIEHYRNASDRRGLFLGYYNLSVDYDRMGATFLASHFLKLAKEKALLSTERCLVLRAKAYELCAELKFEEASRCIDEALELRGHLGVNDLAGLYAVAGDVYFRAEKYDRALLALHEIREIRRSTREKSRIEFELKVIECLVEKKALPSRFGSIEKSEEYRLKWNILRALQGGERDQAARLWDGLVKAAPKVWGPHFSCHLEAERSTIFFSFLESLRRQGISNQMESNDFALAGRLKTLHELLRDAEGPLRKEDLIERIWKCPYDPSFDGRFYKLMERLKKAVPYSIVAVNRTYSYRLSDSA